MNFTIYVIVILSVIGTSASISRIHCNFEKIASTYTCSPLYSSASSVTEENEEIIVNGNHMDSLKDDDITYLRFNSPFTFNYVPSKLFAIFRNIETFSLQSVNLTNITSEAFNNCYKLKSLHIDGNKNLSRLPARFANDCGNLKNLYMPGNNLSEIDKYAFEGLDSLNYLVLTKNNLQNLHQDTFSSVENLQFLFLDQNYLHDLHEDLFYSTRKLQLLSITHNQIEEIYSRTFRNNPLLDEIFFLVLT